MPVAQPHSWMGLRLDKLKDLVAESNDLTLAEYEQPSWPSGPGCR